MKNIHGQSEREREQCDKMIEQCKIRTRISPTVKNAKKKLKAFAPQIKGNVIFSALCQPV